MLKRRLFRGFFAIAGLALALVAGSVSAEPREGSEYITISPPQPTGAKGRIEVTEFFWYGCPHCHAFEPVIAKWLKTLPKDVEFRRVPADLGRWTPGAQLYYALDALGEEQRLHGELFDAIHLEHMDFNSLAAVADWLAKEGVDRQKFIDAYNSSAVQTNIRRSQQMAKEYGISGVPTVAIGGKYLSSNVMAGGFEELLEVVDQLIVKLRAEQALHK